jgi:hypothetical protein
LDALIRARDIDGYMELSGIWGLQNSSTLRTIPGLPVEGRLMLGALLRKFPFEGNAEDRVSAAINSVIDGEESCKRFNKTGWKNLFEVDGKPCSFLADMQSFVAQVLGTFDVTEAMIGCRHGPGSSTGTVKGKVSSYHKYLNWPYHVTSRSVRYARLLIQSDERWMGALEEDYRVKKGIPPWCILNWDSFWNEVLICQDSNRITTVPKDYSKNRPIAIEPTLNVMLQLGVEDVIRRRLRKWNIDLNSQFRNAELARVGSLGSDADKPATIDLSNASDTVSLRLCKLLLPPEWFEYLFALRSPKGVLPCGDILRYRKISSMGNGYTFALESLIFASIAQAAVKYVFGRYDRDKVSVYGDDIIVPESAAKLTCALLVSCGFKVNTEKSFLSGDVKESCGSDWIRGINVRPVSLKKRPTIVTDLISHRNLIGRWCVRHLGASIDCMDEVFLKWIPERFRLYGPCSEEDFSSYLHSDKRPGFNPDTPFMYEWKGLTMIPARDEGAAFFFRKLMVALRLAPVHNMVYSPLEGRLVGSDGSHAFDVTIRNRDRLSVVKRKSSHWETAYSPLNTTPACTVHVGIRVS